MYGCNYIFYSYRSGWPRSAALDYSFSSFSWTVLARHPRIPSCVSSSWTRWCPPLFTYWTWLSFLRLTCPFLVLLKPGSPSPFFRRFWTSPRLLSTRQLSRSDLPINLWKRDRTRYWTRTELATEQYVFSHFPHSRAVYTTGADGSTHAMEVPLRWWYCWKQPCPVNACVMWIYHVSWARWILFIPST